MATKAQVTQAYKELLGRAPDAGGLKFYMSYGDINRVRADISRSPERQKYVAKQNAPKAPPKAVKADPRYQKEVNTLRGQLTSFDKTAENPLDMYNRALDQMGISDVRTRVTDLRQQLLDNENLIRNVEPDVQARLSETLATENQSRRLVAMERQPLMDAQDILNSSFGAARGEYQDILAEGKTQAELEFEGQKQRRQALMDRLQIAINQAKNAEDKARWQSEYNRLVAKDREETRRWQLEYALKQQQLAKANAPSGGSGGGGYGGGSSGGGSVSSGSVKSGGVKAGGGIVSIGKAKPVDIQKALRSGGLKLG